MTHPNDELKACRKAFEKLCFDTHFSNCLDWDGSNYQHPEVDVAWDIWQAAWNTRAKDEAKGGEAVACLDYTTIGVPLVTWFKQMRPGKYDVYTSPRPTADDARDAARYRWLKENHLDQWLDANTLQPSACSFNFEANGHDIDQAIDAAMAERGEGK